MPLKRFKPYTPSRRTMTVADFSELTEKSLKNCFAPKSVLAGEILGGSPCVVVAAVPSAGIVLSISRREKDGIPGKNSLPLNMIPTVLRIWRWWYMRW